MGRGSLALSIPVADVCLLEIIIFEVDAVVIKALNQALA